MSHNFKRKNSQLATAPAVAPAPAPALTGDPFAAARQHLQTQKEVADLVADEIEALRELRLAQARLDMARVRKMKYEHNALCQAIEIGEKQIEEAEKKANSRILQASPILG